MTQHEDFRVLGGLGPRAQHQPPEPVGGAELAAALYEEIDELVLKVNPVTAGAGIPLFAGRASSSQRRFALTDHTTLPGGVAVLTYTAAKD